MNQPAMKSQVSLPSIKLESCLKELKASGATPKQMLLGMLIVTSPAILCSVAIGAATLLAAYYGVFKWLA